VSELHKYPEYTFPDPSGPDKLEFGDEVIVVVRGRLAPPGTTESTIALKTVRVVGGLSPYLDTARWNNMWGEFKYEVNVDGASMLIKKGRKRENHTDAQA
jgi:hypothetical protein